MDVAACGTDIPNVSHVIQAEFATSAVDFLHRVGSTARAGQPGLVRSMYNESNRDLVSAFRQAGKLCEPVLFVWNKVSDSFVKEFLKPDIVISERVRSGLKKLGTVQVQDHPFFDTVKITCADSSVIAEEANKHQMNLRILDKNTITVAFDETTTIEDVDTLFKVFALGKPVTFTAASIAPELILDCS